MTQKGLIMMDARGNFMQVGEQKSHAGPQKYIRRVTNIDDADLFCHVSIFDLKDAKGFVEDDWLALHVSVERRVTIDFESQEIIDA